MQTQLERDLIATRDRIKDPKNWMQGGFGFRAAEDGQPRAECISIAGQSAVRCSCSRHQAVLGALLATLTDDERNLLETAAREVIKELRLEDGVSASLLVAVYNDTHSFEDVHAMLQRAIGTEQQRQRPLKPRIRYDTTEAVEELRRKALQAAEVVA